MRNKQSTYEFSIDRFAKGDKHEFKHVYELYYNVVFTFIFSLVKNEAEAQDIASDGFVKLWKLRTNFKNLNNIKGFLLITARNASYDHFRHIQRLRLAHKEILHLSDEEVPENDAIDALVFSELACQIEDLPSRCKEIFKLLFFQNLNTAEVAVQLNISRQTVLNQKANAIKLLRSALLKKALLPVTAVLLFFFSMISPVFLKA
ncbi:MAG TPA: sigma-70 family RNA polymerase sigma factor [Puia sp.]|nr:sigma-70 family RNA polymerase sigma factor [Puia sp.]